MSTPPPRAASPLRLAALITGAILASWGVLWLLGVLEALGTRWSALVLTADAAALGVIWAVLLWRDLSRRR